MSACSAGNVDPQRLYRSVRNGDHSVISRYDGCPPAVESTNLTADPFIEQVSGQFSSRVSHQDHSSKEGSRSGNQAANTQSLDHIRSTGSMLNAVFNVGAFSVLVLRQTGGYIHHKPVMKKKLLLWAWLILPIIVVAYHYGPGQQKTKADELALISEAINHYTGESRWDKVVELTTKALEFVSEGDGADTISRQLRLSRAHARMFNRQLPEASEELYSLVEEMQEDPSADADQLASARSALANADYYMTWLMRLEGADRNDWEPLIESSRQQYKFLAESTGEAFRSIPGDQISESLRNLEASIRLARMDLNELQGLPLPSQ